MSADATPPPSRPTLDHLGIAVDSLEESLPFWRDRLGLRLLEIEEVESEGVRVAVLDAGGARIELLEPLGENSPIARHLERRGPGLHHVALCTGGVAEVAQELEASGHRLLGPPRAGAGGATITFVHPRSAGGVLLELSSGHGPR